MATHATSSGAHEPRNDVASQYLAVRRMTEELCADISPEDAMLQSMPDASPVKWHLAHTSWFFETFLLAPHLPDYKSPNLAFRDLFNSYYNAVGMQPDRDRRGLFSRPSLEQVREYRAHVDREMNRLMDARKGDASLRDRIVLGLNHEQQHQELIVTDFKHALWSSPIRPAWKRALRQSSVISDPSSVEPRSEWIAFKQKEASIGYAGDGFCFDNELPRHRVALEPFAIASRLVTNGKFRAFVEDGGYRRPELWLSDGWKMVQAEQWGAPLYWEKRGDHWSHYTVHGFRDVADDASAPVTHVSYYEADAYARWAGYRLPTEAEWELAAHVQASNEGTFLDSGMLEPQPSQELNGGPQFFGECWQWTASAYLPYPGYQPTAGALGEYNGKFMVNQMVLRGASCATPKSHARASYRNFFAPASRWQYSGIRLARS
jgi:ergothioneine biosynthesis protein EgtB